MAHAPDCNEPLPPETDPGAPCAARPDRAARHDGWTVPKQIDFLRMLASTQSVAAAARSVGRERQSAYKLRARLDDAPFGAAWRMAIRSARGSVVEAWIDRAVNGVEVPHYWQGKLIGTSRRFDERLTTALLSSGALDRHATRAGPESHFGEGELADLLERIEQGPAEWRDLGDERDFAWGKRS